MEGEGQEQDVERGEQRGLGEVRAGQQAQHQRRLEQRGQPGEQQWKRKATAAM